MNEDLTEIKSELFQLFKISSSLSVPIALRRLLYDTFRCAICQATPMTPPVIFARCCKTILGCQSCVDSWYRGEDGQQRTWPKCREPRAYVETTKLNGLDEFLGAVADILHEQSEDDE